MNRTTALASFLLTACATPAPVVPAPIIDVTPAASAEPPVMPSTDPPPKKSGAHDDFPQSSPRAALESFTRAFDEKRWDVLVRFIPSRHQTSDALTPEKLRIVWEGSMREQMIRIVAALRRALAEGSIEQDGARASLAYEGGTVLLVEEAGVWKIEDFD